MDTKEYGVYNMTRKSLLSSSVSVVDTNLAPLQLLKVLVEGLAVNNEMGLWLTPLTAIPMVPRISPFDLVYLDKDYRVVQGASLLPGVDFPPFKSPAVSAIVLPLHILNLSETQPGDQLRIRVVEPTTTLARVSVISTTHVSGLKEGELSPMQLWGNEAAATADTAADPNRLQTTMQFMEEIEKPETPAKENPPTESRTPRPANNRVRPSSRASAPVNASPTMRDAANRVGTPPSILNGSTPASADGDAKQPRAAASKSFGTEAPQSPVKAPLPIDLQAVRSAFSQFPSPVETPGSSFASSRAQSSQSSVKEDPMSRWQPSAAAGAKSSPKIEAAPVFDRANGAVSRVNERDSLKNRFLRWLNADGSPHERRRASRRYSPGLEAFYWNGGAPQGHVVGDISATGFYLFTEDRWIPQTMLQMTLQRTGANGNGEPHKESISVLAKVVRCGDDGVAHEFVVSTAVDPRTHEVLGQATDRKSLEQFL
jgi:hypothetical protein